MSAPLTVFACLGCGAPIEKTWRGPDPKWCGERCRKRSYGDPCVDCGARTTYGAEKTRIPEPRCATCSYRHRRVWSRELILDRIREWAGLYGEPPATADWNPTQARLSGDEQRARRFELAGGHWPHHTTAVRVFGGWSAAIREAGFEPRAPHGGSGNELRRRARRLSDAEYDRIDGHA